MESSIKENFLEYVLSLFHHFDFVPKTSILKQKFDMKCLQCMLSYWTYTFSDNTYW